MRTLRQYCTCEGLNGFHFKPYHFILYYFTGINLIANWKEYIETLDRQGRKTLDVRAYRSYRAYRACHNFASR